MRNKKELLEEMTYDILVSTETPSNARAVAELITGLAERILALEIAVGVGREDV